MNPTDHMNAVALALSAAGFGVTRVPVGLLRPMAREGVVHGAPKGTADLVVCARGRYVEVECKAGLGRQSPEQKKREGAVQAWGGLYLVARDASSIVAELEARL